MKLGPLETRGLLEPLGVGRYPEPPLTPLYAPPDVEEANAAWGANCGPAALAAVLSVPLLPLAPHFPKPWTNPTQMKAAIVALGKRWWQADAKNGSVFFLAPEKGVAWPRLGLAFLQIEGSWCNPGVTVAAAYRRTHWVAVAPDPRAALKAMVYDINAGVFGAWLPYEGWRQTVMEEVVANVRGATGGWYVRAALEVRA